MRSDPRHGLGFTIEQLTKRSGFDRRTIAYYTTIGLLPKVGRRGPRTTYPPNVLHRLLLVRRIRRLQERGRLTDVTLRDMTQALGMVSNDTLARLARPKASDEDIEALFSPDRTTPKAWDNRPDDQRTLRRVKLSALHVEKAQEVAGERATTMIRDELTSLLDEVDERARTRPRDETAGETLYRVPITDDVLLTVRNIDKKDATLVERMASLLRRLTRRGPD